jgi:hypothetical protein
VAPAAAAPAAKPAVPPAAPSPAKHEQAPGAAPAPAAATPAQPGTKLDSAQQAVPAAHRKGAATLVWPAVAPGAPAAPPGTQAPGLGYLPVAPAATRVEPAGSEPKVVVDGASAASSAAGAHPEEHAPRAPGVPPPLPTDEALESALLPSSSPVSDIPVEVEGTEAEGALPENIFAEADAAVDQGEAPQFLPFGVAAGAEPLGMRPMPLPPAHRSGSVVLLAVLGLAVAAIAAVLVWYVLRSTAVAPATAGVGSTAADAPTEVALADAVETEAGAVADATGALAPPDDAGAAGAEAAAAADGGASAEEASDGSGTAPAAALDDGGEVPTVAIERDVPELEKDTGGEPAETNEAREARERVAKNLVQQGMNALSGRRFADAREAFTRALVIDPRAHGARLGLGRVAFQQGQFEDAVRFLEPAYRNQGNMELGIAYVRVGRTADAKRQFERVLARDPNNAAAQRALQSLR